MVSSLTADPEKNGSTLQEDVERLEAPGGWLVRATTRFFGHDEKHAGVAVALTFVPDEKHSWRL
jgi:hypothetical protein